MPSSRFYWARFNEILVFWWWVMLRPRVALNNESFQFQSWVVCWVFTVQTVKSLMDPGSSRVSPGFSTGSLSKDEFLTGTYPGERGKGRGEVGGILTTPPPPKKTSFPTVGGWNPANQLIGSLSHYLQGIIHPRWRRISAINSMTSC